MSNPFNTTKSAKTPKSNSRAYLVFQDHVFPLIGEITLIGRRLSNHVVLEDRRVSRMHAQIRMMNGQYIIVDLNSTGGTYVNGEKILQSLLFTGDEISISGQLMVFIQDSDEFEQDSEKYTYPTIDLKRQDEKTKPKKRRER